MRALAGMCLLLVALQAQAGRTQVWNVTPEDLARGKAEGLAVTSRGRLFLAPAITPLGGSQTPEGPVQIWSMARDGNGNVYLGTGPEGQILRIGRSGAPQLHFVVPEPLVTALAVASGGDLLAATAPGGTIYRISAGGRGEAWTVAGERYVWSLVRGPGGEIYAGTGERGRILSIGPSGAVEVLFDSDEPHIVSLLATPDGGLLAGGAGRGLVYRVDAEGHALVLHDGELPEVVAVAAEAGGGVVAAFVAPPVTTAKRPAVRLRLPDGAQVGTTDEAVGTLEESTGPTLRGYIEGLAPSEAGEPAPVRGRVVRIEPGGTVSELWSSTSESPFCLVRDANRRILFGTGEPARLYRLEFAGEVARLATLREAQLTGLLVSGGSVVLATSNPAAAYRLDGVPAGEGTYVSRPFDAGGPARWGSIRWSPSGAEATASAEFYTRTGSSREPDETWSAWSPALTDPEGGGVVNPDGRFLQFRLRQSGGGPEVRVEQVSVRYEPYNRRPHIEGFQVDPVDPGRRETRTFRFATGDPDGDPLELWLEYRPAGAGPGAWASSAPTAATEDDKLEWETSLLDEGAYEVRGVASDRSANPAGEGFEAVARPASRLVVDRSPPDLSIVEFRSDVARVRLEDAFSDIRALELLQDGRRRSTVRSDDGVCDSPRETFRVELPAGGTVGWSLRGIDAAGNSVGRPLAPPDASN